MSKPNFNRIFSTLLCYKLKIGLTTAFNGKVPSCLVMVMASSWTSMKITTTGVFLPQREIFVLMCLRVRQDDRRDDRLYHLWQLFWQLSLRLLNRLKNFKSPISSWTSNSFFTTNGFSYLRIFLFVMFLFVIRTVFTVLRIKGQFRLFGSSFRRWCRIIKSYFYKSCLLD